MNPSTGVKDLIVLAADRSMKLSVEALLARHQDLGIRSISFDVFAHPDNDPGVLHRAHEFLRPQLRRYRCALAICDREGCGKESSSREKLEQIIEQGLSVNGWEGRAAAVMIDPELEVWVWGDWSVLATSIRGIDTVVSLRQFLNKHEFLQPHQSKPPRPKEALQAAMKHVQIPFTSAIHQSMAAQAAFAQCIDPAFLKLRKTLREWFPSR